jgi:thiamine kinase-like enzyme
MSDLSAIIERLARRLGPTAGVPQPLEGGITNRNFRVRFGEEDCVVRLPGRDTGLLGISREAERLANQCAAALGFAPVVLAAEPDCLVTRFLQCAPIDPDGLRSDPGPVGLALRAFHDRGPQLPTRFWVPELLDDYATVVAQRGGSLPPEYGPARRLARQIAQVLPLTEPVPCHDDLLPANLLREHGGGGVSGSGGGVPGDGGGDGRVVLVDWEYAGMGHRLFDLGYLAVNNGFGAEAEARLLCAYFGEAPSPGRRAALSLMRIMSDAREAAWGVIQSVVSELDFDFDAYAAEHFERLLTAARDPRFGSWLAMAAP